MAPQFQVPSFVHAQDYSYLPQSIDNLFTSYFQGRQQKQQYDLQQQQLQNSQQQLQANQQQLALGNANFASQNGGLSPTDFSELLPYAGMANPPAVLSPQAQDKLATVNHVLALHQASQQLGAQQAQAGLQKTQAEAGKTGAEANLANLQFNFLSGATDGTGGLINNETNQIKAGKGTLDDLGSMGRSDIANAAKLGIFANLAAQGVNTNALANQQSKNKTTAQLQGDRGQIIGASAGTLDDILNQAAPLVKQLSPSQVSAVNDAYSKGLRSVKNDPTATKFLTYMSEARGKYAQVLALGNSPSELDKQNAAESIARGLDPQSYDAMHEAVNFAAQSTQKRFMGQGFNEAAPAPASAPTVKAGNKTAPAPALAQGRYSKLSNEALLNLARQQGIPGVR